MQRGRAGALLAVGAALIVLAPPGSSEAKTFRIPPGQVSTVTVRGSNGYRITIEQSQGRASLTAGTSRSSATYVTAARPIGGGGIGARFPGLGRVSLRFEPSGKPRKVPALCRGRRSIEQPGVFRGRIEFRGEMGFTHVAAAQARGHVLHTFASVCHGLDRNPIRSPNWNTLETSSRSDRGRLAFQVVEIPGTGPIPTLTFFSASTFERRRGMAIIRSVNRSTRHNDFAIAGPSGQPESATIAAPTPFHGNATFHAVPGKAGAWEGAISVELPGAGTVELTGAPSQSQLCLGRRCVGNGGPTRSLMQKRPAGGARRLWGYHREEITREVVHLGQKNDRTKRKTRPG
jgi:hypothetical protein